MVGGGGGGSGGGGGGGGGLGGFGLDVDEESLALARDAAKKEDYEWFMEFIGTGEDDGGGSGDDVPASSSSSNNNGGSSSSSSGGGGGGDGSGGSSRDDYYSSSPYYNNDNDNGYDVNDTGSGRPRGKTAPPRPRSSSPRSREFQPPSTRGVNERRGERPNVPSPAAAADTAYDYDLDDEFDGEPGRGGWEYDPGLAAGVGARLRDVDIGKLRAHTRAAAMRVPLEEEKEGTEEAVTAGGAGMGAGEVEFEPVGGDKAVVLTGELGYTEQEVACIDPDMADLAIERGIRRPVSGMPDDWVGVGATLSAPTPSSPASSSSSTSSPPSSSPPSSPSLTLEGEGGGSLGEAETPALSGALDLDEILSYDTADNDDTDGAFGYEGRRGEGTRRGRPPPLPSSLKGGVGRDEDGRGDVGRRYDYEDMDGNGNIDYDYDGGDGFSSPRRRQQRRQRQQRRPDSPRGRREDRARRPARELDPAEKYERSIWGDDDDDNGEGKIWTGVGPDGPWPTLEEFTKLLREETDVRLSIVGPWAAEVVAVENKFRIK
ncbi:unnamed protein product, partial [Laminaria digitata]